MSIQQRHKKRLKKHLAYLSNPNEPRFELDSAFSKWFSFVSAFQVSRVKSLNCFRNRWKQQFESSTEWKENFSVQLSDMEIISKLLDMFAYLNLVEWRVETFCATLGAEQIICLREKILFRFVVPENKFSPRKMCWAFIHRAEAWRKFVAFHPRGLLLGEDCQSDAWGDASQSFYRTLSQLIGITVKMIVKPTNCLALPCFSSHPLTV